MRRRNEAALLRQIAKIRDLQRVAAEVEAARASSALREREKLRAESERGRQITEQGWLDSLSIPSLRMVTTHLWSAALLRQEGEVRQATRDVDAASAELDRCTAGWHLASMRHDAAEDMAHKATRERIRYREELALQDASDRHAQRRSAR